MESPPKSTSRSALEYDHEDENRVDITVIKATKKITEDVNAEKFEDIQKCEYADIVLLDCFVLALFYAIGVFMEVKHTKHKEHVIGDATVEVGTWIFSGLAYTLIAFTKTSYIPVYIMFHGQQSKVKPCMLIG
ncbi:unnamed protein product [Ilex paraguariensis]|uniref:Uncharacterized protein n=1 Tax=Ilex paraguariensis TaxID=185542 RepID=A0ABC8SCY3_9AQUA